MIPRIPAMAGRRRRLLCCAGGAAVLAALAAVWVSIPQGSGRRPAGGNTLGNPPGMVDRLVVLDTAAAWNAGQSEGVEVVTGPADAAAVRLAALVEPQAYPLASRWTSPTCDSEFPFT